MNTIQSILSFAGGLGLFIYGMEVMADGLQKAAGEKTKHLLEILTGNRLMAILIGAAITAIIQSSSATTVLVVGFVNAGLMNLSQAVGVIMGANIGTTMTAWIVSMGEWAKFLQPDTVAPVFLVIGVVILMSTKRSRLRDGAGILIGFGLLFIGLSTMSGAITPYADSPIFVQMFTTIGNNPLLGVLVGLLVTALMQSSSASMGILQTLALTGVVNWGSAIFIALGQNIGTCVTALLSSLSADTNAKRAAIIHLEFNVLGALIVGTAAWIFFLFEPGIMHASVNSTALAIFHTSFNVAVTLILFPFANGLVRLSELIIPGKKEAAHTQSGLDPRMLANASVALNAAYAQMQLMGKLALDNISLSRQCMVDDSGFEQLYANEEKIDDYNRQIGAFLADMNTSSLSAREAQQYRHCLLSLRHIEHIGDRTVDIARLAQSPLNKTPFSEKSVEAINTLSSECWEACDYALKLRETRDPDLIATVNQYEQEVDNLEWKLRQQRLVKLTDSADPAPHGVIFLEVIDCYERIANHAKSLAGYIAREEGYKVEDEESDMPEASLMGVQ